MQCLCITFEVLLRLYLGPSVPLGASGDEKSPSLSVTGDPAGSMPADTHLFRSSLKVLCHVFFGLPPFLLSSSGT